MEGETLFLLLVQRMSLNGVMDLTRLGLALDPMDERLDGGSVGRRL